MGESGPSSIRKGIFFKGKTLTRQVYSKYYFQGKGLQVIKG